MKINLLQFITFSFVIGWISGQVLKSSYEVCLALGLLGVFISSYLNNVHGILWKWIVKKF